MTRACSKSSFPRPYIWRFTSLSLVICPSLWPFDHDEEIAAGAHTPRQAENVRVLLLAAQITLILDPLGGREQAGIDGRRANCAVTAPAMRKRFRSETSLQARQRTSFQPRGGISPG
jgi:hypothetical protein